jgi:hypothetical protein
MTSKETLNGIILFAIDEVMRKLERHHPTRWAILQQPVVTAEHGWEGPDAVLCQAVCAQIAGMGRTMVVNLVNDHIRNGQMDTGNSHDEIYSCTQEWLYEQLGVKPPWKT